MTYAIKKYNDQSIIDTIYPEVIFNYFSRKEFHELLEEALDTNCLEIPCITGQGLATCKSSVYLQGLNILKFEAENGLIFYVIQRLVLCDAIVLPSLNTCIPNPNSSRLKEYIHFLDNDFEFNEGVFNGVINGYHRPYHYFYDKLYPLLNKLDNLKNSESKIPFINVSGNFLDLERIDEKFIMTKINDNGFYLSPSKSQYTRTPGSFFNVLKSKTLSIIPTSFLEQHDLVLWLGFSLEKRIWSERTPALILLIKEIKSKYKNPVFIFDGLTSTYNVNPEKIRTTSSKKEVKDLHLLLELLPNTHFLDLIGATAEQKITIASKVDFFISSHLTDSIWCAALNSKPGITYRPNSAIGRGSFIHPLTNNFPDEQIVDSTLTSTGDFDGVDISINPFTFSSISLESIKVTKFANDFLSHCFSNESHRKSGSKLASDLYPINIKNKNISIRLLIQSKKNSKVSIELHFKDIDGVTVEVLSLLDNPKSKIEIPKKSKNISFNVEFKDNHTDNALVSLMIW